MEDSHKKDKCNPTKLSKAMAKNSLGILCTVLVTQKYEFRLEKVQIEKGYGDDQRNREPIC